MDKNNGNDDKQYDISWLKGTSAEAMIKKENKQKNFSNPVYKKLSKINGKINDMSVNQLVESLNELNLDTSGKKEVLIKRLKNYHKESKLKEENVENEDIKCRFDYVCVIDYEATCTENNSRNYPHEIIEFPIVLVNMKTLIIEDTISFYCKPVINPKLSKFCTDLTGIRQEQIDSAEEFGVVLEKVKTWFESHELGTKYKFTIACDGPWDMQNFLNLQCCHSNINYPRWAKKWIDIRKLFSNWFGVRRCGINKMLDYCGFVFEGKQHCGLDDAKNIAKILIRLAKDGCPIKKNDRIKKCLTEIEKKEVLSDNESVDSLEFPEE